VGAGFWVGLEGEVEVKVGRENVGMSIEACLKLQKVLESLTSF
jgi:hypothetical protein